MCRICSCPKRLVSFEFDKIHNLHWHESGKMVNIFSTISLGLQYKHPMGLQGYFPLNSTNSNDCAISVWKDKMKAYEEQGPWDLVFWHF